MNKKIITSIIVLGIVLSLLNVQISQISSIKNDKQIQGYAILDLVSHDPILITHDDNFTDYGFSGSGTAGEPYIIENYAIVTTNESGIYVNGTSKHFVIRNCHVEATEYGIFISHVTEGTASVVNNTCMNNFYCGILVLFSSVATVANNTCTNNNWHGIFLGHSSGATLTNNTCTNNNRDGIYPYYSSGATLTNNTCTNNNWHGIFLGYSSGATLTNNTCTNNDQPGIWLGDSSSATLTNNTCTNNNRDGIYLYFSSGATLTNNTCTNNNRDGIYLYYSGATLTNNTCNYNQRYGASLHDYSSCLIIYNNFQKNEGYGIYLAMSFYNIIHHNNFEDNNLGGTSQAYDDGENNIWYDEATEEGNYWSEWNKKRPYRIDGDAKSKDRYPLNENLERTNYEFIILIPSIILVASLYSIIRKRRQRSKK